MTVILVVEDDTVMREYAVMLFEDWGDLARSAVDLLRARRVLYRTGNSVTEGLKSLFVGGSGFISKPYTHSQLPAWVASLLSTIDAEPSLEQDRPI
jgi:hypothetical protein